MAGAQLWLALSLSTFPLSDSLILYEAEQVIIRHMGGKPTDHSSVVAFSVLDNSSKFSILHGQSVICRAGKLFLVLELAITCMHAHEHSLYFNLCPASPYFMSDTFCVPCLCICASTYFTFSAYSAYSHNSV